jgi:hypothetical protein
MYQAYLLDFDNRNLVKIGTPQQAPDLAWRLIFAQAQRMYPLDRNLQLRHIHCCEVRKVQEDGT